MKEQLVALVALAAVAVAVADPNPYADYGAAMKSTEQNMSAVDWSKKNDAAIAAATEESVLAALVADAASADALLAKIGTAYDGDPIVLTQIAAVTQWVMLPDPCFLLFWKPCPSDGRAVWTAALARKIAMSQDGYVRTFCRQQLDLCK